METLNQREELLYAINKLPSEMLEEMYKFLSFLEYSLQKSSKEEILKNLQTSAIEMKMIKKAKLTVRSAKNFRRRAYSRYIFKIN